MRWIARVLAAACVLAAGFGQAQAPPRRVALVIGNAAYTTPGWALVNPVNDATLIAARLRSLGFEVDPVMNASKAQMEAAFARFGGKLKTSGADAVGFFYYAGHGAQKDGVNLLVPVDVTARTMDQLRYQAPPMQFLLDDMADAGNAVNIIILDACRNVPLLDGQRSGGSGGLAEFAQPPPDVLIAYATRAGYTAPDNPGETNSVFTRTLAEALLNDAGDPLELMFSDVQAKVFSATAGAQRPEYRSGLVRAPRWSFRPGATRVSQPAVQAPRELEPIPDARTTPRILRGTVLQPGHNLGEFAQFRDCEDCPDMIMLPSGQVAPGSPGTETGRRNNENIMFTTSIDRFAIGRFEVTFRDWEQCVQGGGCRSNPRPADNGWGRGMRPVINVSWADAQEYAAWLSGKTGQKYRLPSEAEWEYAARGRVTQARFFWGNFEDQVCPYANTASCGAGGQTVDVGKYRPNAWGLYDVAGNVYEWAADCYELLYPRNGAEAGGAARTTGDCTRRPVRGGSWRDAVTDTRSAVRGGMESTLRSAEIGFRIARSPY